MVDERRPISSVANKIVSRLFELALVFVRRLDHIAGRVVNANHSMFRPAEMLCVSDCVADRVRLAIPQPTERQHIGNQVDAALIFAWADFVSVS